jgi:GntR family transcriptional regulator
MPYSITGEVIMLHIQIDAHSGVPAYRQVMDQIKLYTASGALPSRQQLPSIRDLARSLAVNPSTIVKAYNELQHEGIVEMRQGKGVFVKSADRGLTKRARRDALRPLLRRLVIEAQQLGLTDELGGLMDAVIQELDEQRRRNEGHG